MHNGVRQYQSHNSRSVKKLWFQTLEMGFRKAQSLSQRNPGSHFRIEWIRCIRQSSKRTFFVWYHYIRICDWKHHILYALSNSFWRGKNPFYKRAWHSSRGFEYRLITIPDINNEGWKLLSRMTFLKFLNSFLNLLILCCIYVQCQWDQILGM